MIRVVKFSEARLLRKRFRRRETDAEAWLIDEPHKVETP
jgi:hypothetical protein